MKRLTVSGQERVKEQIQLYFARNDEAKYIHRLHTILLYTEREEASCNSTGLLLGHSPRTISNWIRRINETGDIESLRSKKQSGRPTRLSERQRQELIAVIGESPGKHGISGKKWDGKRLSAYIGEHYGIIMRTRTCQRLFHQLGVRQKRAYPFVDRTGRTKQMPASKNNNRNGKR